MTEFWLAQGTLLDGTGAAPRLADICVADGKITAVEPAGQPRTGQVIDVSGKIVLPGLIDAHAHVGIIKMSGQNAMAPAVQAATIFNTLADSLRQGFTTLRDLGGVDGGLVEAIETGLIPGPRLLPSGEILSQSAGHGDSRRRYSKQFENDDPESGLALPMRLVDGVPEALRAARDQFRRGATQLKVFATGGVLSHGDPLDSPQFSLDELKAINQVAEDRNSYVTAHAHTARGIARAIEAGITHFEHATIIDDVTITLLAESGSSVVPTVSTLGVLASDAEALGIPAAWLDDCAAIVEQAKESVAKLYNAGVTLGSGADLIGPAQTQRGWEIAAKAEVLGAQRAIESATRVNAEILGVADEVGTVEVGKAADLVVFGGDVLANPQLFCEMRPELVWHNGVRVADGDE
jgi:imidazolonepropionase-like amidohydrolase